MLALVLGLSGCAPYQWMPQRVMPQATQPVIPLGHKVDMNNSGLVLAKLNTQYSEWAGVPHRTGGMSKKGVDCSALVYITFKQRLGLELPRSAAAQARVGEAVAKDALRPGDLVFFRTQWINRHVGIYLGEGKFMHVSSKRGVMVSRLSDYYWVDRFSGGRRVR